MAYCQHCGAAITSTANYCPYCGAALQVVAVETVQPAQTVQPVVVQQTVASPAIGEYSVMILSLGTATRNTAARLITSTCGYSAEEALLIADATPITLARDLPKAQALCLAQALTERGLEVSLYDGYGYQEIIESENETIFDKLGGFITSAAAALGLISARNRLTRSQIRRMDLPYVGGRKPPVLRVQHRAPAPAPRPAVRVEPTPRPVAHHEPVPGRVTKPATRPAHTVKPTARPGHSAKPAGSQSHRQPNAQPREGGHGGPGGHGGHRP